jgi:hypothetical protein
VVLPELDAYIPLSSRARLFLLSAITEDLSRETTVGELGVNLDLTLKPILRRELGLGEWERERYLWVRVGYRLIGNLDDAADSKAEHRGIFEVTGRIPLLWDVWLVDRARVDLRDVGGEFSARLRPRVGLERRFTIGNHAFVPYLQAEAFYDTRFGDWSRERYAGGAEYELTEHWRVESYFRRQEDRRPARAHENGVGFVLKYYY